MSYNIYLDDERFPKTDKDWTIIRTYQEFIDIINDKGSPLYISFDHDIHDFDPLNGEERTGMTCAKWLVEKDMDMRGDFLPAQFSFNVHSANTCGGENIRSYLTNYLKFKSNF